MEINSNRAAKQSSPWHWHWCSGRKPLPRDKGLIRWHCCNYIQAT